MRFLPPPLAVVLVVLAIAGCSSDPPPSEEAAPDAPEETAPAEGEEGAEETEGEAGAGFPVEPIDVDGLGPCDLLSGDAAGRLGLPETGAADENALEGMTACDWEDLAAGIYIGIILDTGESAYQGFELLAQQGDTELVDVEGYPAFETEEFDLCVVQLALAPDAVATLSGFQNGGSGADCEYLWEAAEEVVATLA